MKKRIEFYLAIVFMMCVLCSCGDGGGTDGTGVRSYTGTVVNTKNSPVNMASITVAETGDSSMTDTFGAFNIKSSKKSNSATLVIARDNIDTSVVISDIPEATKEVKVAIQVNETENSAEATRIDFSPVKSFALHASFVGRCSDSFEGERPFIQTRYIPNGTYCTLKTTVYGDGKLLGGILVGIERKACGDHQPWRRIVSEITETQPEAGVSKIVFPYADSERACEYRIVAPLGDRKGRADTLHLFTFTGLSQK